MTASDVLTIISGVLQFPGELLALIKSLQSTPAEQQQALVTSLQKEAQNFQATGRPTWS